MNHDVIRLEEILENDSMLEVYSYSELHTFLRDAWLSKKGRNQAFSLSAWARQLGFENSSPLSLALKGKRNLPKKYLPLVIKSLDLNSDQATYLEGLFDLAKAKSTEERLFYFRQLQKLAPKKLKNTTVDEFKSLSEPIYGLILEMSALKGFQTDPYWIQKRIKMSVDIHQVSEAIQRLVKLELLKIEEKPRCFKKTHKDISTENDISDLATKEFHKAVSQLAAKAVAEQDVNTREFQSFTFNIRNKDLKKAKEKIRKFLDEFLVEFEAPEGEGDESYQLNVQLFSMTK
jgi:uncharacterized protein (TIGR02147 family)